MNHKLLIAEDDEAMSGLLTELANDEGFQVQNCANGKQAYDVLLNDPPDALLADIQMPEMTGIELIEAAYKACPGMPAAIITGYATVPDVVRAFRAGAIDLITKPFENKDVRSVLTRFRKSLERDQRIEALTERLSRIEETAILPVANSRSMQKTMDLMNKVAELDTPVLLNGATGSGKSILAHSIHSASPRHDKPWFSINCGALSDSVAESELFGHEKGSFTGAHTRKRGILELAHGGTLFLDEINSASQKIQTRLLDFIQDKTIRRVGGEQKIKVDVRLVSASNENLESLVKEGSFREDLWYRLNVFPITVPDLRDRREDIIPLAESLLHKIANNLKRPARQFSEEVEQLFLSHNWSGNVRELENCIHRAAVLCNGTTIERQHLPDELASFKPDNFTGQFSPDASLSEVESIWISHMLSRCEDNKSEAARRLGIDVSTLHRKLRELK